MSRKIAVAVTGASGSVYARQLLEKLSSLHPHTLAEIALVMSDNARTVWKHECGKESYKHFPVRHFEKNDFMAPFASGSSTYDTLVICPCSMGTLARIAAGTSDDLITRAADVMLKERRRLILMVRETPYNLIHINNMQQAAAAGAIILPCTPSFYNRPQTIEEVISTVTDRAISLAGLGKNPSPWNE